MAENGGHGKPVVEVHLLLLMLLLLIFQIGISHSYFIHNLGEQFYFRTNRNYALVLC